MKYYSEKTQELYGSIEELEAAEKQYNEAAAEEEKELAGLAEKKAYIEEQYAEHARYLKNAEKAQQDLNAMLISFMKKYGYLPEGYRNPYSFLTCFYKI